MLAAFVAVLATVFGAATVSAATASGGETRVQVSESVAADHARPPEGVDAGQRLGIEPAGRQIVVATGVATKTGEDAFHYTSTRWIESITTQGLRKGSYATPSGSLSPLQASLELALPPNRALPDAIIRIDLAGLRKAAYEIPDPTRVSSTVTGAGGRTYNMPGGGYEIQFPYAIPPEFLKVVP